MLYGAERPKRVPRRCGYGGGATSGHVCKVVNSVLVEGGYRNRPLVEHWNGSSWSVVSANGPSEAQESRLVELSCPSTTSCMATGTYRTASSEVWKPFAERLNSGAWAPLTTPLPSGNNGEEVALDGIACAAANACRAVGSYRTGSFLSIEIKTLVEVWDGSSWTAETPANPSGAKASALSDVFCSASTACTAVGRSGPSQGFSKEFSTLAERWD